MLEKSLYFKYLMPGNEDVVTERINDFIWFDENNILCSVPKETVVKVTLEESKQEILEWEKVHGNKKFCMITVVNPYTKSTKEERDFIAEVFPKYISALAVINDSALGRMAINLFIGLRPPSYPLKVFKEARLAKEWLQQYNN